MSAAWREREGLDRLLDALDAKAGATRFVGGVVRDTLLGLETADVDLATRLRPDEVARRIGDAGLKAVPTGIAHGTVTAVLPSGPVEVTTLRRDVATDGRHAEIAFSDDWREDAARRDFTINALSAGPDFGRDASAKIHDYFGGRADLAARRVRFIGDPFVRIAEDHLRILRFFRFHARFGAGAPDADGLAACTARANDLMALSRERIAQEVLKLLVAPNAADTVAIMVAHGIFTPVLPEIDDLRRLRRTIARETHAQLAPSALLRLVALLPDAAAGAVAARLKLSNADRKRMEIAAAPLLTTDPLELRYRLGAVGAQDQLLLADLDDDAVAAKLAEIASWPAPRFPLTGGALVTRGLSAGPSVAATLKRIEDRWIAEGFPDAARVAAIADEEVAQALRADR